MECLLDDLWALAIKYLMYVHLYIHEICVCVCVCNDIKYDNIAKWSPRYDMMFIAIYKKKDKLKNWKKI